MALIEFAGTSKSATPGEPSPAPSGEAPPVDPCQALEEGNILYFRESPIPFAADDLDFLLSRQQSGSGLHKNIAYKPASASGGGAISGLDRKTAGSGSYERLRSVMEGYSRAVEAFLRHFLASYQGRWRLDYASFRPQEEQGRDLPLRRRNDLMHTDAFPTRPSGGDRILRFFNNIHPSRSREWVVSDPFGSILRRFAPSGLPLPEPEGAGRRALRAISQKTPLGKAIPSLQRTPYDLFMMRFHNFLKESSAFQSEGPRYPVSFPPGSSWMVFTDMVPHAVLSGQYALEQTFLVDRHAMVAPENSPLAALEGLTRAPLV